MTRAVHNGAVRATATEIEPEISLIVRIVSGADSLPVRMPQEMEPEEMEPEPTGKQAVTAGMSCVRRVSGTEQGSCCEGAVDEPL